MTNRFNLARQAEIDYHERLYKETPLFSEGSWLVKPAASVIEAFNIINKKAVNVLDLGCGIGRNSIPIAQLAFSGSKIVCVDLLETAIDYLTHYARLYEVDEKIVGLVHDIEHYDIAQQTYDFIVCCSSLEHLSSEEAFIKKVFEIKVATKPDGIVCILLNTDATEENLETGEITDSLLELNLISEDTFKVLESCFNGWKLIKKTSMKQSIKEHKDGKHIILSGNWIAYIVQNS